MRTLRSLTIALAALFAFAAATPALAQSTNLTPGKRFWPAFKPSSTSTTTRTQDTENEQGLGVFLQGGWVRVSTYGPNGLPTEDLQNTALQGWLVGIAFGGNKSATAGVGVDINYMVIGDSDTGLFDHPGPGELSLHYIDIPVYARINFFGHETKNRATLYAIIGGFVDILLKGELDGVNVKEQFNGFDMGIVAGAGFEAARLGIELRGNWALRTLQSTGVNHNGNNTFKNGLEDTKKLTIMLLFRLRLN